MTRDRWIGGAALVAAALPYLQVVPFGGNSYTQPLPLFLGALSLLVIRGQFQQLNDVDRFTIIGFAMLGAVLFIFSAAPYNDSQEYKYLLNYVTPLAITVALLTFIRTDRDFAIKLLVTVIGLWIGVAVIQVVYSPTFGTSLLGQWGDSAAHIVDSGRGVLGFAPEPTHHAFHILVLGAALILLDRDGKWWWVAALCVVDAVVLAQSSSAMLVLALAAVTLAVWRRPFYGLAAVVLAYFIWPHALEIIAATMGQTSRTYLLLADMIQNPTTWITSDYSVNIRISGVWAAFTDVWHHAFMPRGLGWETWMATRADVLDSNDWILSLSEVGPASGIGILLFQGGFLVLPFLWAMFRRILPIAGRHVLAQVLLISTPFVFVSQYYLSAPSFAILYACALSLVPVEIATNDAPRTGDADPEIHARA